MVRLSGLGRNMDHLLNLFYGIGMLLVLWPFDTVRGHFLYWFGLSNGSRLLIEVLFIFGLYGLYAYVRYALPTKWEFLRRSVSLEKSLITDLTRNGKLISFCLPDPRAGEDRRVEVFLKLKSEEEAMNLEKELGTESSSASQAGSATNFPSGDETIQYPEWVMDVAKEEGLESGLVQDILSGKESERLLNYKYLIGPDRFDTVSKSLISRHGWRSLSR